MEVEALVVEEGGKARERAPAKERRSSRNGGLPTPVLLGALGLVLLAALVFWILVGRSSGGEERQVPAGISQTAFEEQTGIRVTQVAVTGGGGLIDFRYQVLDPDKASALHDEENRPALVDERSGEIIDALLTRHAAPRVLQAGRTYYLLFLNRKGLIKPGRTASVVIGDSRVEHVTVQ